MERLSFPARLHYYAKATALIEICSLLNTTGGRTVEWESWPMFNPYGPPVVREAAGIFVTDSRR